MKRFKDECADCGWTGWNDEKVSKKDIEESKKYSFDVHVAVCPKCGCDGFYNIETVDA